MISIAIILDGGLGDLIIYTPALKQLYDIIKYPFDIFSGHYHSGNDRLIYATAPFIKSFNDSNRVNEGMKLSYDVIIHLNHFVRYHLNQPQNIQQYAPVLFELAEIAHNRINPFELHLYLKPNFDRIFADYAVLNNFNRNSLTLHAAGLNTDNWQPINYFNPADQTVFERIGLANQPYITIHDGWDNYLNLAPGQKATKSWPDRHWLALIQAIKKQCPELKIVQLGNRNSTGFTQVDDNLINQTTISETAWILAQSRLHIDTETGLVHVAKAMGTISICLTGPTNAAYYNYPDNINIVSQNCRDCWWIKPNWMSACVRDLLEPECMASITPAQVMQLVRQHFSANFANGVPKTLNWFNTD